MPEERVMGRTGGQFVVGAGMNRAATVVLGISLGILTLGFTSVACFTSGLEGMRAAVIGEVVLGGFCATGALACLLPVTRPIAVRLVGGMVFLTFLGYFIAMVESGPLVGSSRSDPSLVKAIAAFSLFGLPAGYVAITGRYPRWGRHAAAFRAARRQDQDATSDKSQCRAS